MTKTHKLLSSTMSLTYLLLALPVYAAPADTPGSNSSSSGGAPTDLSGNPIVKDINLVVNFLSIGVGVVVIIMIILGGIQYAAAGDNPQAVNSAKQRIANALIALVAYIFMFAFLQWLIPGGIF